MEEWKNSGALYEEIYNAAELYGIYEDLFRFGKVINIKKIVHKYQ